MNQSPLVLHRYFFTKIELSAHTDGAPGNANLLTSRVSVGRHNSEKDNYLVRLEFTLGAEKDKPTHYTGSFEIHGYVSVVPEYPREQHEELVATNGPAILYSAIREMLLNLTARGPWPQVMLKTVSFRKIGTEQEDKTGVGQPMQEIGKV